MPVRTTSRTQHRSQRRTPHRPSRSRWAAILTGYLIYLADNSQPVDVFVCRVNSKAEGYERIRELNAGMMREYRGTRRLCDIPLYFLVRRGHREDD